MKKKRVIIFHFKQDCLKENDLKVMNEKLTSFYEDTDTKPLLLFGDEIRVYSDRDDVIEVQPMQQDQYERGVKIRISDIEDYILQKEIQKLIR